MHQSWGPVACTCVRAGLLHVQYIRMEQEGITSFGRPARLISKTEFMETLDTVKAGQNHAFHANQLICSENHLPMTTAWTSTTSNHK